MGVKEGFIRRTPRIQKCSELEKEEIPTKKKKNESIKLNKTHSCSKVKRWKIKWKWFLLRRWSLLKYPKLLRNIVLRRNINRKKPEDGEFSESWLTLLPLLSMFATPYPTWAQLRQTALNRTWRTQCSVIRHPWQLNAQSICGNTVRLPGDVDVHSCSGVPHHDFLLLIVGSFFHNVKWFPHQIITIFSDFHYE